MSAVAGNRRGPDGYLCCKHCAEDAIHDVPTDGHDGLCSTCDDPGAMLRERAEAAEAKVARVEAVVEGWFLDSSLFDERAEVVEALRVALTGADQ